MRLEDLDHAVALRNHRRNVTKLLSLARDGLFEVHLGGPPGDRESREYDPFSFVPADELRRHLVCMLEDFVCGTEHQLREMGVETDEPLAGTWQWYTVTGVQPNEDRVPHPRVRARSLDEAKSIARGTRGDDGCEYHLVEEAGRYADDPTENVAVQKFRENAARVAAREFADRRGNLTRMWRVSGKSRIDGRRFDFFVVGAPSREEAEKLAAVDSVGLVDIVARPLKAD